MSRTSPQITDEIRSVIRDSLMMDEETHFKIIEEIPQYTLTLPDFNLFPEHMQEFIRKDLIEVNHINGLTMSEPMVINWHSELSYVQPLKTEGDGNCLLHAVSLGMWGVHDRDLLLRMALYETMTGESSHKFRDRWRLEQSMFDDESINNMWLDSVEQTKPIINVNEYGKEQYNFLEQLHIFVLAHILRRPIIVYAESVARHGSVYELPLAERIDGIYLPLCWSPDVCRKDPLALSFFHSHFCPLVGTRSDDSDESVTLFPLVDASRKPLPIRFINEEEKTDLGMIERWLNTSYSPSMIYCAEQKAVPPTDYMKQLIDQYLFAAEVEADEYAMLEAMKPKVIVTNCAGGCGFTGTSDQDGYCSQCYKRYVLGEVPPANPIASVISNFVGSNDKCLGGCGFHGSPQNGGYCSVCAQKFNQAPAPIRQPDFGGSSEEDIIVPCQANGCTFNGTLARQGFCSVCYKKFVLGEGMNETNNNPYYVWR
eukprot:TRINITY_DN3212_c0_g1_i2.p1 TRINITY_DN3212_c0_g1~~TRINITY_DN3212_c0_g1_i2.p1  ORF type:complete len:509 (+),score=95.45 TRINITY_DN3212_c0_g1_i2:81-1529(+)